MNNSWIDEVWRIIGLVVLAVILGLIFKHVQLMLLIAFFGYTCWTLFNLRRLRQWLLKGRKLSPPRSFGIWGDILTELYRLQKRNKKRHKRLVNLLGRFRETTEAMPDGIVVMEESGAIEWWNEAAGKMLDLKYPQDVGQRITNLLRTPEFMNFYTRGDKDENFSFSAPGDDTKTIAVRITPYGKNQFLLVARDVTLLERVERIRRDFVANISHELRTPLTVMSGFLETMATDEQFKDPQTHRSLQLMQQQSKRMYRLVEDLMLLSKLENEGKPIKHEVVTVPQMLTTLKEEAEIVSGDRQHKFVVEIDPDLYIYGDAKELDSAFSNLVVNAVNYTPEKGQISLRWYEDENGAHFEVEDNGIGIPPHHIARLTERFYRVDVARSRETGGSGLGLAIVKHALNRHDARLRITSEVGRGSTFFCDFPKEIIVHKTESRQAI